MDERESIPQWRVESTRRAVFSWEFKLQLNQMDQWIESSADYLSFHHPHSPLCSWTSILKSLTSFTFFEKILELYGAYLVLGL